MKKLSNTKFPFKSGCILKASPYTVRFRRNELMYIIDTEPCEAVNCPRAKRVKCTYPMWIGYSWDKDDLNPDTNLNPWDIVTRPWCKMNYYLKIGELKVVSDGKG